MARSTYVYVVMIEAVPVAGFTVKHELVTWLKVREADRPDGVSVWRVADGKYGPPPALMSIDELLA